MDPENNSESSSWQASNIGSIFADLGHQVAVLDEVRGQSLATDVRDKILFSLTALQNRLDSETSSYSSKHLETLFRLIDCRDLLISCCSSQLVKRIAVQPSCQAVIESAWLHQWSEMLSLRCSSSAGILHRIEILRDIFSKRSTMTSSLFVDSAWRVSMGSLLVEQWEEFLRFVFHSSSDDVQQSDLFPNIILSTCSLWKKLIQMEVEKSSSIKAKHSTDGKIFLLTDVLLERLITGFLPQISHRKCLGVLLECLPNSSILSTLKVIPPLYHELARRNLRRFKDSSVRKNSGDGVSGNVELENDWVWRCVTRNSTSQGFGGFCSIRESCSDCVVDVDGERRRRTMRDGVRRAVDETVLRKLVLLWIRSLAVEAHYSVEEGDELSVGENIWHLLKSLESFICSVLSLDPSDWLMRLFGEQDDDLFEASLCLLDIFIRTKDQWPKSDVDCIRWFDPCWIFLQFLRSGCWDHTLLLDLLISPETCFLIYLTRLLKHILSDWDHWVAVCRNKDEKEEDEEEEDEEEEDEEEEDEEDDVALRDAQLGADCAKDFISCKDVSSGDDEFEDESVDIERGCSEQRSKPSMYLSSLKQLKQSYTGLVSERNSDIATENEDALQGRNVVTDFSSLPSGRSNAVPDLCPNDVKNQSSLKKIIDYSDSDSNKSELEASLANDMNDENSDSCKRAIPCDDLSTVTDMMHEDYSGDVDVKISEKYMTSKAKFITANSTSDPRQVKEVIEETDLRNSSTSYEHCVQDEDFSFKSSQQVEFLGVYESEMNAEIDCTNADVMYDELVETEEEEWKTSVGEMPHPLMDNANAGEEKCDVIVNAMTTLIRLRLCLTRLIDKDMFPYDVGPLERLLESCEENFEEAMIMI